MGSGHLVLNLTLTPLGVGSSDSHELTRVAEKIAHHRDLVSPCLESTVRKLGVRQVFFVLFVSFVVSSDSMAHPRVCPPAVRLGLFVEPVHFLAPCNEKASLKQLEGGFIFVAMAEGVYLAPTSCAFFSATISSWIDAGVLR